jgi:hypothetical protein
VDPVLHQLPGKAGTGAAGRRQVRSVFGSKKRGPEGPRFYFFTAEAQRNAGKTKPETPAPRSRNQKPYHGLTLIKARMNTEENKRKKRGHHARAFSISSAEISKD